MINIFIRYQTHFVLWCPTPPVHPPELIIGEIRNGNPPTFRQIKRQAMQQATKAGARIDSLWDLDASTLGFIDGTTYHYWFEVDNTSPGSDGRIQTTDPLARTVDYRLYPVPNPSIVHPASVVGWEGGKLVSRDPNGEHAEPVVAAFAGLPSNNQIVIYELPTAWTAGTGSDEFERAVGTFRDVHALVKKGIKARNFPDLPAAQLDPPYLVQLGINALEMLPPTDSIYAREWGYGTSHYLSPDYELGYPEGHLSPTANQDLTALINSCHETGIRVFLDVVLGFMKEEPYRYIDFDDFYLENPEKHPKDVDAYSSREGGGIKFRNAYGASCPRYGKLQTAYDPISGDVKQISPAQQHMLTFITRWMQEFQIDGIRMDSVENVANWDFVEAFKNAAHEQFAARYPTTGPDAKTKFLVVGEELEMPHELLTQNRLDGLWNERFQAFIRAALIGENAEHEPSFEWTVRRVIDCQIDKLKGQQVVNYLTSHDVEGKRKERLYNQMVSVVSLATSETLVDRSQIEADVRTEIQKEGHKPTDKEVRERTDQIILHTARLRRIKLGFVCLMTAVGIPMILAGEEFGDQHDLFNQHGNVTHQGGKQVDPVNFRRFEEPERKALFDYVARLVTLRVTHSALSVDVVNFIHVDFEEGKRVLVWRRGSDDDPIVVVANFSDFTTPHALASGSEYFVPNWPPTPAGKHWFEVTQSRDVKTGRHNRESIFAWEAKVYRIVPGNN